MDFLRIEVVIIDLTRRLIGAALSITGDCCFLTCCTRIVRFECADGKLYSFVEVCRLRLPTTNFITKSYCREHLRGVCKCCSSGFDCETV